MPDKFNDMIKHALTKNPADLKNSFDEVMKSKVGAELNKMQERVNKTLFRQQ